MSSSTAPQVAIRFLESWVMPYRFSTYILTDNGPKFTVSFFASLYSYLVVKQITTIAYNTQGNGQTERFSKTIVARLHHYVLHTPHSVRFSGSSRESSEPGRLCPTAHLCGQHAGAPFDKMYPVLIFRTRQPLGPAKLMAPSARDADETTNPRRSNSEFSYYGTCYPWSDGQRSFSRTRRRTPRITSTSA